MAEVTNNIQEGYYSTEIKADKPKGMIAEGPTSIPRRTLFSDEEANRKIRGINNDIYTGTKKEKSKNDFNKGLYFKIFGGLTIAAIGIASIDKVKKFFKKP